MTTKASKPLPTEAEASQALYRARLDDVDLYERRKAALPNEAAIRASWYRGDSETYSSHDFNALAAERVRLDLLTAAAKRRVADAKAKLIPSDISLAEACAGILSAQYELAAEVRATEPGLVTYEKGAEPRLIVVQQGLCTRSAAGVLAGRLTVYMVRGKRHRPTVGSDVLDALEGQQWSFRQGVNESVLTMPTDVEGEVDEFDFEVGRAFEGVPVVSGSADPETVASAVSSAMRRLASEAMGTAVVTQPDGQPEIISDHAEDDHRIVVGKVGIIVCPRGGVHDSARDLDILAKCVGQLVGLYLPVGLTVEASLATAGVVHDSTAHAIGVGGTITVTMRSRAAIAA